MSRQDLIVAPLIIAANKKMVPSNQGVIVSVIIADKLLSSSKSKQNYRWNRNFIQACATLRG